MPSEQPKHRRRSPRAPWPFFTPRYVSASAGNAMPENARLFALLNIAMADAAICAWDAKYAFNFWRPVTAIRNGDTDGDPTTEPDPAWSSFIVTPPFPTTCPATALSVALPRQSLPYSTTSRLQPARIFCLACIVALAVSHPPQTKPLSAACTVVSISGSPTRTGSKAA